MENQKEVEFDLMQMLRHLLRRAWIIVLATVIFAGAGYIYTKKTTVPMYTASCRVFVYSENLNQQVGYNEVLVTMYLKKDCQTFLTGRNVTGLVVEALELKVHPDSIGNSIRVSSEDDSRILEISYTDSNPKRAAAILNKVVEIAGPQAKDKLKVDDFVVLYDAEVPTTPSSTNIARDTLLAAAIGFVLSAGILIVLFLLDDTIRNEDDVDRFLGLSTLTTIPVSVDLASDGKISGKKKKKSQVWLKRK